MVDPLVRPAEPSEIVWPAPTRVPARRGSAGRASAWHRRTILISLAPGLVVLLLFFGVPFVGLIRTSLSTWNGIGDQQFIGMSNYADLLTDPDAYQALGNSVILGASAAVGVTIIALILGAFVSSNLRGSGIYRVLWFLPSIAPPSAVAVFWSLSVQPNSGVVNSVLGLLGLGDGHAFLASASTALYVVIAVAIWQGVGFAFLIVLGAMEEVPVSAYEAAAIDGCSPVRRFFSITLPLIRPVLSMVLLLETIWAFNGFTIVWGMTQGGPGNATVILPVLVYQDAFLYGTFGPAAALSIVGGIILLVLGVVGQWFGSRKNPDQ